MEWGYREGMQPDRHAGVTPRVLGETVPSPPPGRGGPARAGEGFGPSHTALQRQVFDFPGEAHAWGGG